ncbi:MAG: DUF4157 domain-containing protein, partial [Myxococcota bacterium]
MKLVRDKKKTAQTAQAAARRTRARVAETEGEAEATQVRLPSWRALVGEGPREDRQTAKEAEVASAPPAAVEATPAEAQEDIAEPDAEPTNALEAPASEQPIIEPDAPVTEPPVSETSAEDSDIETKQTIDGEAPVLRWARSFEPPTAKLNLNALLSASTGRPLPNHVRDILPGLPPEIADRVSLHTDGAAAHAAAHLNADAFTVGPRVFFAAGRFQPDTAEGLALLSHELAHVVQHGEGKLAGLSTVSRPNDPIERDADLRAAQLTKPATLASPVSTSDQPTSDTTNKAQEHYNASPTADGENETRESFSKASKTGSNRARELSDEAPMADGSNGTRAPSEEATVTDGSAELRRLPTRTSPADAPVLRRATDQAKDFLSQGHFAMADGWSDAGSRVGTAVNTDAAATAAAFPKPTAELGPQQQPERPAVPAPASLQVTDEIATPSADAYSFEESTTTPASSPATPSVPYLAAGADGDASAAQANYEQALNQVPTTLDGLSTNPGPPPNVTLDGPADPAQADTQREEATANIETLQSQAAANVDMGPGPEQVQPRSVRETQDVSAPGEVAIDELAAVPRMAEIEAGGKVTEDIQAKTDELGQAQLEAGLADAKGQLDTAADDADAKQAQEVESAESENQRLSTEANAEQAEAVQDARADIDTEREQTKREQQQKVDEADVESEQKRQDLEDDVDQRIADDERQIETEFRDAETDAEAEKNKAEADAQAKKDEAERDADNDSWWDRALSAIADAFEALTDFINEVFDAAIAAVGEIIDAVKAAATALINAARAFVIEALQELGEALKGLVDDLLGDIFPELAAALNELIDAAVDFAVAAVNA